VLLFRLSLFLWQTTNFSQQLSPEFFARFVSATDKVACTTTKKIAMIFHAMILHHFYSRVLSWLFTRKIWNHLHWSSSFKPKGSLCIAVRGVDISKKNWSSFHYVLYMYIYIDSSYTVDVKLARLFPLHSVWPLSCCIVRFCYTRYHETSLTTLYWPGEPGY